MCDDNQGLPFELDRARLRRAFERAAATYDRAAFLHREVGQRLLERLDLIKLRPETILDVGCGVGSITAALMKKYRGARVIGLERAAAMVASDWGTVRSAMFRISPFALMNSMSSGMKVFFIHMAMPGRSAR